MHQSKIYDIAGAAGVSLATVSRVINHPEKVKKATRDRVMNIIKNKGYIPNANARGLASRKSTTVAVVVPTLNRASVSEMIQGIYDSANHYGYTIRLFITDNLGSNAKEWGEIVASSVDGILFMNDEMSSEVYSQIKNTPVPVVFVNSVSKDPEYGSVCINNEQSAYNITKNMIEKGRKKILFITTEHIYTVNIQKEKGYKRAMEEGGLTAEIIRTSGKVNINEEDFRAYFDSGNLPEVALAVRDSMAISFMNLAQKRGIKVPEQLEVIGFQNTRYAILSNPKLTCVDTPIYEIGNRAMSQLTELMQKPEETKPINEVVENEIIWRESTR